MIHPDTRLVVDDGRLGHGVVATRWIPRGTITWVRDPLDRTFTAAEIEGLPPDYEPLIVQWTFGDDDGQRVLCWDLGRYLNHSCDPNCGGTELGFEVALRDIEPGEQLTNDYETFHLDASERFVCRCAAPSCRGVVQNGPDPAVVAAVRRRVVAARAALHRVDQPLAALLPADRLTDIESSIHLARLRVVRAVRRPLRAGGLEHDRRQVELPDGGEASLIAE